MTINQVKEETTFTYTANLVDESDTDILKSTLEALTLEVYEPRSTTRLRTARDAYDDNDVTIATSGLITWLGQLEDTRIVATNARLGSPEIHTALFQFAWGVSLEAMLTNPLSVTSGSSIVTVAATAHGIVDDANEDHVFLVSDNTVGGLNLNGSFKVNSIIDADSFTVIHNCTATSTEATVGGTVKFWVNPRVGSHAVNFSVLSTKPDC
jgi:hypothetical protein